MKYLVLAFMLSVATISCHKSDDTNSSQNGSQAPSAVKAAFNAKYPAATGQIEYEPENGNTWKVKFFIGSQRWQAIFNADGSFVSEKAI